MVELNTASIELKTRNQMLSEELGGLRKKVEVLEKVCSQERADFEKKTV